MVGGQFGVELGELDVEAFYARVDLGVLAEKGGGLRDAYI